ncbi:DMT family transporter [Metabacillus sediminilitoris]|jgi:paired small multidrug resistance pump|uniref:Multidrug efflux SMR transporter n=1 Tax=Metabacillus sediminilitoris TaxID=2567941 RepID=A0A4S4C083_9BACI|nr:multidrug efflux SMR transporter [Metabacillus sediminilitoris]QGQ47920.1 QacE family quaternary ammonium compound efflux SMR transporter [Metabacillus sediminilitoris]THF80966.1 multidrug efflux SMR transporter [Metabacillus sediminilitoris]
MAWVYLILAGFCEVAGVAAISKFNKKKSILNMFYLIAGFTLSFSLLSQAMESISMGTAYAVWTGIGTVGSALIGILFLGESASFKRIFFITVIITSTIGLKFIPH